VCFFGQTQPQQKAESQIEKYWRLLNADSEKQVVGSDNRVTIESIETTFQPQVISGIGEITGAKLSEPGRPYYFKLRAVYKGYDADAKRARLQDLGQIQANVMDSALGATFGVDSEVYSVKYVSELIFKGQSNTTIRVSTDDNVLTERMSFTGRASEVKTGDKIRIYYTIAKDPLEKWEIQAIECL
jgi:hypothetical protein